MANFMNMDFDNDEVVQEAANGSGSFTDLFDGKFESFDPATIVNAGNRQLKSGFFDIDVEDSNLALGYKNQGPATTPKPGRFF